MNKYEQRVREIAEEMARQHFNTLFRVTKWDDLWQEDKEDRTEGMLFYARITVKHMAEAYEKGFNGGYDFRNDPEMVEFCQKCLKDEGLIPDQEAGNDDTGK